MAARGPTPPLRRGTRGNFLVPGRSAEGAALPQHPSPSPGAEGRGARPALPAAPLETGVGVG